MSGLQSATDVASRVVAEGVATHAAAGWAVRRASGQWHLSVGGDTDAFFDLASLTKPMTAMSVARTGLRSARLGELLFEARHSPSEHAPVELLLAHRSGLEANLPLFKPLVDGQRVVLEDALTAASFARRADSAGVIPTDGFAPLYSDLGYMLVGEAMARALGANDMGEVLSHHIVGPLGLAEELGSANALERFGTQVRFFERVVPTEVVPWRGGKVRGRVHDENAFALRGGGACGHAGMFGTISAVLGFGVAALDAIARRVGPLAFGGEPDWLVRVRHGSSLRAGFDGKSEGTGSSAGTLAGPRAFGHLGFTGTSMWIDPDAEAVVVLLTNRVNPSRANVRIRGARPWAHDALFAMAGKGR